MPAIYRDDAAGLFATQTQRCLGEGQMAAVRQCAKSATAGQYSERQRSSGTYRPGAIGLRLLQQNFTGEPESEPQYGSTEIN